MSNEKKDRKITVRMEDMWDEWEELPNHINCSRSEFLRQCVHEKVNQKDELTELRRTLKEEEFEYSLMVNRIRELKNKIAKLEKVHENNLDDEMLMSDLMDKIRNVAMNEGLTEDRIIAIANDKVNPKVLMNKAEKEGFEILSKVKHQKQFVSDENGQSHAVKLHEKREKTHMEVLMDSLKRKRRPEKKSLLETLELYEDQFIEMCEQYDDLEYSEFKEHVESLSNR